LEGGRFRSSWYLVQSQGRVSTLRVAGRVREWNLERPVREGDGWLRFGRRRGIGEGAVWSAGEGTGDWELAVVKEGVRYGGGMVLSRLMSVRV
jgi:hypothetical protein